MIAVAQLFGTSLWFSINGVWLSMSQELGLRNADLGYLTVTVQAGFIVGTLLLGLTGFADRVRASHIFAVASLCGAMVNAGFLLLGPQPYFDWLLRFLTGLCLAAIYPLGMKLVISWGPQHAGAALSWLVGMLTVGTALPHLMRGATLNLPWEWTLLGASLLALVGGLLILTLGDGPHLPGTGDRPSVRHGLSALQLPGFRAVAGGYFGHCWELYAFWMLVPLLVGREISRLEVSVEWVPWLSFAVIAGGFVGCVWGGRLVQKLGSEWVARHALAASGALCLAYPLLAWVPPSVLLLMLGLWGMAVIADSPQFAALAAANAPRETVGSSLALMNGIGFALTIPPIWLTSLLWDPQGTWVILWLLPGPLLGLWAMKGLRK